MNHSPPSSKSRLASLVQRRESGQAGVTLVELMIAFGLFIIVSVGVLTSMLQVRRMSEDNFAQATAEAIAQGIIEQVQVAGYTSVVTTTVTDPAYSASIRLSFVGASSSNLATIQAFDLPWAPDATTFTAIGERVDPTDPTSAVRGILLDMNYVAGSSTIRPKRYMPMRVNLQRTANSAQDNVQIVLTYSWLPPSRAISGSTQYITREIRTIRSEAPSY